MKSFVPAAAVVTALSLTAAPAFAQVYTADSQRAYEDCKKTDRNNQILGGIVGGLVGGVIGDKIEDGEGTIIGGAAGAYAGTRIANKDCSKLLVQDYGYVDPASTSVTYDQRTGQYVDTRTGAVVSGPNGSTTTQPTYSARSNTAVAGSVESAAPSGMVRVTDSRTGEVFFVSQADYDRYYR
ncbi:MAG: hypothetical protein WBF53_05285 [Litorimonas sp.]